MHRMTKLRVVPLVAMVLLQLGMAFGAVAQTQDKRASREREALRQLQQMVQQMRQENDALGARLQAAEQENQALVLERDRLAGRVRGAQAQGRQEQSQRAQLQSRHDALALELQTMAAQRQSLQAEKDARDKALAQLRGQLEQSQEGLARANAAHEQLAARLAARERGEAACEDKNLRLYQHGRDLIAQCQDRSSTDTVLRLEPFTGIGRVAIENLLQEYRDKLEAQKLQPRAP
jgi:chromosome segregation ATPase